VLAIVSSMRISGYLTYRIRGRRNCRLLLQGPRQPLIHDIAS